MLSSDLLVIGGGAVGLCTAWCAARRGLRVTLLERDSLGAHSSWAAGGILPYVSPAHARTPYERAMAEAARLHPLHAEQLRAETGVDIGYTRAGEALIVRDPTEPGALELHEAALARHRTEGATVTEIDPRAYGVEASGARGHLIAETALLRPPWYLRALTEACRARGVTLRTGAPVVALEHEGTAVIGARTAGGDRVLARTTVLAAGAWTAALCPTPLPVRPVRGQMVLLKRSSATFSALLSVGRGYLVPRPDGRVLVGSTMEDVGFAAHPTAEGVEGLLRFARSLVPALAQAEVERAWAGLRPATPSGEPIVGPVEGHEGLWVATGHTRQGVHLAAHTGEWVAEQLAR